MDITSLGHAAFRIKSKIGIWVTDPFDPEMVGLPFPAVTADLVTISHDHKDHNASIKIKPVSTRAKRGEEVVVLNDPGEYEVSGMEIVGIAAWHDNKKGQERGKNTLYKVRTEEVTLVHLGDLGHELTDSQVDMLDEVDILFVPVGGVYTIDALTASKVVNQLEPLVVIPMHYQRPGLNPQVFKDLAPVAAFLQEMGLDKLTPVGKYSINKAQLPEEPQVVVIE